MSVVPTDPVSPCLIPIQARDRKDFHGHLFAASNSCRIFSCIESDSYYFYHIKFGQHNRDSVIYPRTRKRLFLDPTTTMPLMLCSAICNPASHTEWCLWLYTGSLRRSRWLLKVMGRRLCIGEHSLRTFTPKHSDAISQTVELYVHGLPAYLRHH